MDKCGSAKSAEEWEIIDEHINGSIYSVTRWLQNFSLFGFLQKLKIAENW